MHVWVRVWLGDRFQMLMLVVFVVDVQMLVLQPFMAMKVLMVFQDQDSNAVYHRGSRQQR